MKGTHSQLIVTTATDEATGDEKPLFAFPVQICKAIEDVDVTFERAAPSGAEYETCYRDTSTGDLCEYGDLVRGVRSGDSFSVIAAEMIKEIEAATKLPAITVIDTVPLASVPRVRGKAFSFLQVPVKGGAHKAYRATFEALGPKAKKGKAPAREALALKVKFAGRTRQKFGVVFADEEVGCLVLQELLFGAEIRQPDEQVLSPQQVEVDEVMIGKVRAVLDGLRADEPDFDTEVDEALAMRGELVEKALMGEAIPAPRAVAEVVEADEVLSALEASLEQVQVAA